MAVESYGRCDDGVHWAVYHELPLGQWWWMIRPDGGERIDSPQRYATEKQALAAVEAARAAAVAGRPVVETMESLRARAEAAEARAAQAEAEVAAWRDLLLSRVRGRCGDPDLHTDRPGAERPPVRRLWRVVSHRGVVSVGATEGQALLRALDARERRDLDDAVSQAKADERHWERAAVDTYLRAQAEAGGDPWMVHVADEIWVGSHRPSHAYPEPVAAPV